MLDKLNSVQPNINYVSKERKTNKPQATAYNTTRELPSQKVPVASWQAYSAINFKGLPENEEEVSSTNVYLKAVEELKTTSDTDTLPVDEAIKSLRPLQLNNKDLMQYLLGSSFDNGQKDAVINKKAILYAIIFNLDHSVPPNKIPQILATLLDNDNMAFNEGKMSKLFIGGRFKKYSATLKPVRTLTGKTEYGSMKAIAMYHKQYFQEAIEAANLNSPKLKQDITYNESDVFKPLSENKSEITKHLTNAYNNKLIGKDLYQKLCSEINDGNFDIKAIYNDYYSLLNECSTLDEVHELYPELPIPFDKIGKKAKDNNPKSLNNRFAKEDWNKIGLQILRKMYLDFQSPSDMMIKLENSYPTTYTSMLKGGYSFGAIPNDVKTAQSMGLNLLSKFKDFDELSNKELEFIVKKNASKKSRVWAEYIGITNKYWTKTRAIMHKLHNPDTTYYQTDKLVDGYLFNLYKNNADVSDTNPLSKYADGKSFTEEKKNALENIYRMYKNNFNPKINSPEFQEFKKKFDVEEMKESLTKLEKHYKNTFFNWFYTTERKAKYAQALDESYTQVLEKLQLCDKAKQLELTDVEKVLNEEVTNEELAEFMFEDDNFEEEQANNKFHKFKKLIFASKNQELQVFFNNYIGNDSSNRNGDYYQVLEANAGDDLETGNISNPEKLLVMLKLHSEYIDFVLNNNAIDTDEEEFTAKALKNFENSDGTIDYVKANEYLKAKAEVEKLKNADTSDEFKSFSQIVDTKFLSKENNDYTNSKMLLEMYLNTSDSFKPELVKIAKNCNLVSNPIFIQNLQEFTDFIKVWNIDNDEIITMDADKLPQKVVITSNAKKALLGSCNGDLNKFDTIIRKFFNAATQRTGKKGGQGVKHLGGEYEAELKILGSTGSYRLYAKKLTDEDINKYGNVKYVFDIYDEHL